MSCCPVCNSVVTECAGGYRATSKIFSCMERRACLACELHFANPMPSAADLHEYNAAYFDNAHGGIAVHAEETAFFSAIATLRMAHVANYLSDSGVKVADVLEVGPGAGHFAAQWLKLHPNTNYRAIETDANCHAALTTLGVRLMQPDERGAFDLVVLSHVLEHVSDPKGFLRGIIDLLKPGGVLFIEVPCNDWQHKTLDEPHLLFFDKKPMGILLESLSLVNVRLSYHGRLIEDLKRTGFAWNLMVKIRLRMIRWGFSGLFARQRQGMESVSSPLQRSIIAPFEAHLEQAHPAWWLRALATKKKL